LNEILPVNGKFIHNSTIQFNMKKPKLWITSSFERDVVVQ